MTLWAWVNGWGLTLGSGSQLRESSQSQLSEGGGRGCCEVSSKAYEASDAGELLWPVDLVMQRELDT